MSSRKPIVADNPWEDAPRVRRITLNRPDKRNALDADTLRALLAALERARDDADVGVVVITGAGPAFCAGADINEFHASLKRPVPEVYEEGRLLVRLFQLGEAYEKPLIAAVNGPALGGGIGLVALCHFAIAAREAKFGATELRIGMFPMVIFPALRRALGHRRALELSLTARIFAAPEAERIGLVQRVVAADELEKATQQLATRLAGYSPAAVGLGMRAVHLTDDVPAPEAYELMHGMRQVLQQTEDLHEGTAAFFEKRAPRWTGR